jgi:hypothetical protein
MSPRGVVVTSLGCVALAVTLAGLFTRGLVSRCYFFAAYLGTVCAGDLSATGWPELFFTHNWFVARQAAYLALKLAISAELCANIFAAFPGAERSARVLLLAGLCLTLLSLTLLPDSGGTRPVLEDLIPRASNGALWLMLGLGVVARWYFVPLHPLDKAILGGFVVWGVPFVLAIQLLRYTDWSLLWFVNWFSGPAYVMVAYYWLWRVWTLQEPDAAKRFDRLQAAR